jgi:hypothetical protein
MEQVRTEDAVKFIENPPDALGRFDAPVLKIGDEVIEDADIIGTFDPDITAAGHVATSEKSVREHLERLKDIPNLSEERAVEIAQDIVTVREAAEAAGRGCMRG